MSPLLFFLGAPCVSLTLFCIMRVAVVVWSYPPEKDGDGWEWS